MLATVVDVRSMLAAPDQQATTAASLPDGTLQTYLEHAGALVNTYLAGYEVPLDADGIAPPPVRGWIATVAAYLAHLTWMRGKDVPADEPNRLRYDEVMQTLRQVRDRQILLAFPLTGGADAEVNIYNHYSGRLLTRGTNPHAEFAQRETREWYLA